MFDDRQPVTGVSGTVFGGLRRMPNSTVNAKRRTGYIGSGPHDRVIAFTSSRCVVFCVGLIGMIVTSLYKGESKGTYLVLAGYNRRVIVLLQNLAFLVSRLS